MKLCENISESLLRRYQIMSNFPRSFDSKSVESRNLTYIQICLTNWDRFENNGKNIISNIKTMVISQRLLKVIVSFQVTVHTVMSINRHVVKRSFEFKKLWLKCKISSSGSESQLEWLKCDSPKIILLFAVLTNQTSYMLSNSYSTYLTHK